MKGFPHADYPDAVRLETPALFMRYLVLKTDGLPFRMPQHRLHDLACTTKR